MSLDANCDVLGKGSTTDCSVKCEEAATGKRGWAFSWKASRRPRTRPSLLPETYSRLSLKIDSACWARRAPPFRLFSAIHMQIVYAQYQSPYLQDIRFADYRTICEAVIAGDVKTAEAVGARHVKRVRKVVLDLAASLR